MAKSYFVNPDQFVFEEYAKAAPFASFLPGIAGLSGIPLWVFYVNRGQGIASFGVKDKNGAISEFLPAHKAYQLTPLQGFRTFIKRGKEQDVWEPFGEEDSHAQTMVVEPNRLKIATKDFARGLRVEITYFIAPYEPFGALVRRVQVTNLGTEAANLEVLDGLAEILPFGLDHSAYKELGFTLKSWTDIDHVSTIPFYHLRASTSDDVDVQEVTSGHFYLSILHQQDHGRIIPPIVDKTLVFGEDTTMRKAQNFMEHPLHELVAQKQVTTNKIPCGFTPLSLSIMPGKTVHLTTLIGHVADHATIVTHANAWLNRHAVQKKEVEAQALVTSLTDFVATKTNNPLFDAYCRQSFLDNLMRGGLPYVYPNAVQDKPHVYHAFSRKHGDLERDYNFFAISPTFFAQGNGNFRDVNQNRRLDVFFQPQVGTHNIHTFIDLWQADGYNPLVLEGSRFRVQDPSALRPLVEGDAFNRLIAFWQNPFEPGELLAYLLQEKIVLTVDQTTFMERVLAVSTQEQSALHGEGFWVDHFTYNLDLIENYLAIFPDRAKALLFEDATYRFYDAAYQVVDRAHKTVFQHGEVCQRHAVIKNPDKEALIRRRQHDAMWMRDREGQGAIVTTTLFTKLFLMVGIKTATLDPHGLGIEMEAGKPGWNDSLNGLPGLFGSGFSELVEVLRLVRFLQDQLSAHENQAISVFQEGVTLWKAIEQALGSGVPMSTEDAEQEAVWHQLATARETYRQAIAMGFSGEQSTVLTDQIVRWLEKVEEKLTASMARAKAIGDGLYPTYFYYQAKTYEAILQKGKPCTDGNGDPLVRVTSFTRQQMPLFLEGEARALKVIMDGEEAGELHQRVKASALYDQKLQMYKSSESILSMSHAIGRARAFTPGWLENESIFMHVEYKYLLALLQKGLYAAFFAAIEHALVPFLDPSVYGRSTLEHSSFIASSANPDEALHGRGFIARLSGSTVEFLQMWTIMMFGHAPFRLRDGELTLQFAPILPGAWFTEDGELHTTWLGSCSLVYENKARKATFGPEAVTVQQVIVTWRQGEVTTFTTATIPAPYAEKIRDGEAMQLRVILG